MLARRKAHRVGASSAAGGSGGANPEAKAPGSSAETDLTKYVETARNVLGLLLVGFIGALNFVGLKSTEVTTVLRNESIVPTVILVELLVALLLAVWSVFESGAQRVAQMLAVAVVVGLIGLGVLTASFVSIPSTTTHSWKTVSLWIGLEVIGGAIVLAAIAVFRSKPTFWLDPDSAKRISVPSEKTTSVPGRGAHLQLVLLLVGAMLAMIATYTSVRLETRSQLEDPTPSLGAKVNIAAGNAQSTLDLSVSASKLRAGSLISILVFGLPRSVSLDQECAKPEVVAAVQAGDGTQCPDAPCRFLSLSCEYLDTIFVGPDSNGAAQEDFVVPFSGIDIQHLNVRVQTCEPVAKGGCTYASNKFSRLDLAIPSGQT